MKKQISTLLIGILLLTTLACQAAARIPNPFATATPTATSTFTPSPTPSPTPTATFTPTPPPTGRIKQSQPDGSTIFIDYDGGYSITAPIGWKVAITDKNDVQQIIDSLSSDQSDIKSLLEQAQSETQKILRGLFFTIKSDNTFASNVNIGYDTDVYYRELNPDEIAKVTKDSLGKISKSIKVIDSGSGTTAGNVKYAYIVTNWTINVKNQSVLLYQKMVFFHSGNGTVVVTMTTLKNLVNDFQSDFDQMISSIKLLK